MPITRDAVLDWLKAFAAAIASERDHLTELDSAIGDADHGANMDRGFQAVLGMLPAVAEQDVGAVLKAVGMKLVSTVGGASGPLYGTLFLQMGAATAGKLTLSPAEWAAGLGAGVEGVARRGRARRGEKTMIDSLVPATEALSAALEGGASLEDALWQAERAARRGMLDTTPMVATKGRASYLGERSAGHQDPGATSAHLLVRAAAEAWAPEREPHHP
ncbi:MAG TPA: dihydroxyacetone kinase subunit DhaL [Anaeromyxobacter sp.]|nr:dihydroxyacetone kinase subunit DhaL [Anaeromyxobacter sp.]